MKLIEPPWAFLVMNSVIPLGRTSRMTVAPDGPLELATTPAFANVFAPVSDTTRAMAPCVWRRSGSRHERRRAALHLARHELDAAIRLPIEYDVRGVRIQRRADHQSDLRVRIRRVFGWGIRANHAIFNRLVQEEE